MERKNTLLPTLAASKSKSRMTRDKFKIEELLLNNTTNRMTHQDYRADQEYCHLRATNFLSRIKTIDSPHIVFTIADQIKEAVESSSNKENKKQNDYRMLGASPSSKNFTRTAKNTIHIRGSETKGQKAGSQQRESAIQLAKWLDQMLEQLRGKQNVTFLDILDYKQTVLNYALGRIIDSLAKRCKQQAQILSLVWEGTFQMFSGVFTLLAAAKRTSEDQKIAQAQQLQKIFETNLNFVRQENQGLQKQNKQIFDKMKNVILWNKRLRKERKNLHTSNRILQYRNSTYSQALEQTIQMVLQASPDPIVLQTAKKMITKLAREKARRRKNFKSQVDGEVESNTREVVFRWLRKNSYLDDEKLQLFKEKCFTKEDGFLFSQLDDLNEMKKVNIYDFFKLYDVGCQASPSTSSQAVQFDKIPFKNAEVMTKNIYTTDNFCQTLPQRSNSSQFSSALPHTAKKHVQISTKHSSNGRKRVQSKGSKQNKEKNTITSSSARKQRQAVDHEDGFTVTAFSKDNRKRGAIEHMLKDKFSFDRINQNDIVKNIPEDCRSESENRYLQISAGSMLRIEEERLIERAENNSFSEIMEDQLRTKAYATTKRIITNNSQICELSEEDAFASVSSKMITYSQIGSINRRQNQKRSMAYIRSDIMSRPLAKLQHKKFQEAYQEQKEYFESNKEDFVDQLIRRRSFFSKRRVQFATFKEAEEVSQKLRDLMRGTRYGKNFHKGQAERNEALLGLVDKWIKRGPASSNMAKSKALNTSKGVFELITSSLEGNIRIPPKNKMFVSNSLSSLSKYFSDLVADYLRQIKREKEDIPNEYQKALYPLSLLFMDRMTFKYGLKEIAEKKIRHFIQKVISFASISQKVSLYSLLLGLEDKNVGTDQLLVYLKSLVYFEEKKPGRDTSTQSNLANIELVRQHLRRLLEYFFDSEYINLIELRLEIYFQQSAPYTTVEGIALIIIRELLKRKKELRSSYSGLHSLCAKGDNFFINLFKLLKISQDYRAFISHIGREQREPLRQKQAIDRLKDMRGRGDKKQEKTDQLPKCDIAAALRELIKRSDIIDEEYGKSITQERFITAAVILNIPTSQDLQALLQFMGSQAKLISKSNPDLTLTYQDPKSLESLAKKWKLAVPSQKASPIWGFSKIFADKIEEEVMGVLGKVGTIGLATEHFFFNAESF